MTTRRTFLGSAAAVPAAAALRLPLRWLPDGDDRALVVVELEGGNDGLNTLIPLEDERWAKARPSLAGVRRGARRLPGSDFALHASLERLSARFERGHAAAVHGVGYTPPDRSHFKSRDIWHTADPDLERASTSSTGWLGRAADQLARQGAAVPGLAVGSLRVPLALRGHEVVVPALASLEDYVLHVSATSERPLRALAGSDDPSVAGLEDLNAFVDSVAQSALSSEQQLRDALARYRPHAEFDGDAFGRAMQLASRVLVSGFGTRLIHVSLGGFDTHANQAPTHAALLAQLDRGLGALLDDLEAHRKLDSTAILVHSEFGRRVAENGSHGTDHGAAAPVFVAGGAVRAGLHGEVPNLDDLDDGDVRATTDFRSVYADLLGFLGVEADAVLRPTEGLPERIGLFATR